MKKGNHTKVYSPNFLSYALNDDLRHLKVWKQKLQENKDVQQKKQIDRILQGVIKQRMFGEIITKQVKDSPICYYTIDQISKSQTNPNVNLSKSLRSRNNSVIELQNSRRLNFDRQQKRQYFCQRFKSHESRQQTGSLICYTPRKESKQIKLPSLPFFIPKANSTQVNTPLSGHLLQRPQSIKSIAKLKTFQVSKNKAFPQYFRQMADNHTTPIIFDVKITRQKFIHKNKAKIPQKVIQKMSRFFNFPHSTITYKQYCNFVQKLANAQLNIVHFFTFTLLDESENGFLTISDLFKLMQNFPQNKYIQEEVFHIREDIIRITKILEKKQKGQRLFKPTVEQTIISNHKLGLEEVKNLLKQQPTNHILRSSIPKVSVYQDSIMALQHDFNIRLKQEQIQSQQANKINKKKNTIQSKTFSPDKNLIYQEGMKFSQFSRLYRDKRPRLYCLIIGILTGQNQSEYQ